MGTNILTKSPCRHWGPVLTLHLTVNFFLVAENIAMAGGSASDGHLGTSSSSLGHHVLSWSKMETNIIDSIRKASYEATAR